MKTKALLIALLAMALVACNNTPKENNEPTEPKEQTVDALGTLITADGLVSLKKGTELPDTIPGYEITPVIVTYEEDMEELELHVIKDGKTVVILHPGFIEETDEPDDIIGAMTIVSDQFATADGIHVGSSVQDLLKKDGVKVFFDETKFHVTLNGIDYILFAEDYEGELPAVPFDIMAEVEHPTFKADAKVREIFLGYGF